MIMGDYSSVDTPVETLEGLDKEGIIEDEVMVCADVELDGMNFLGLDCLVNLHVLIHN